MTRRLVFAVALVALPWPAAAANKDIERLQIQVASLQGQIAELQRAAEDNLRELKRLNETLAEQNAFLRRGVEDRRLKDEAIASSLRDLLDRMAEVNEQLQVAAQVRPAVVATPSQDPEAAPSMPAPGPAAAPPPAPRELYSQAYADYARGNYDVALQAWSEYLRNYPDTDLSDNAQYWIGECHYARQKYAEAIEAWNELFRQYPASDKLPDARYKKAMALERLGRRSQALIEYRYVADRFPNSEAGRKAREKLNPR